MPARLQALLQRQTAKRWKHRLKLAALALVALVCLRAGVFGPSGYLALQRKQQQYRVEQTRLARLQADNLALQQSVRALKTPAAIEAMARNQLHLVRPNEVVLTYGAPAPSGLRSAALRYAASPAIP